MEATIAIAGFFRSSSQMRRWQFASLVANATMLGSPGRSSHELCSLSVETELFLQLTGFPLHDSARRLSLWPIAMQPERR